MVYSIFQALIVRSLATKAKIIKSCRLGAFVSFLQKLQLSDYMCKFIFYFMGYWFNGSIVNGHH